MPQYFLTVPHDSADEPTMESMQEMDPADLERLMAETAKLNNDLTESKVLVHAGGLHPPSSAIMVDATSTPPTHTPGPFVEADQYVGGFWIIDVADEAAALQWAERCSAAVGGAIEVRTFQEPPQ